MTEHLSDTDPMPATKTIPKLTKTEEDRFWNHIRHDTNGCWIWTGSLFKKQRYGRVRIRQRLYSAHRIAWYIYSGQDPLWMDVLHCCDNPPCCNPKHLFIGDHVANMEDAKRKGRFSSRPGEMNPNARLTNSQVVEIRSKYRPRVFSVRALANQYHVGGSTIHRIIKGKSYGTSE